MNQLLPFISRYSAVILAVLALSYGLPAGFDKVFGQKAGNPLLFYSPLSEKFIYRESLGGHRFNYLDEDGSRYDRPGFEAQLPFLYYKNLEKKKLLPVEVAGHRFDKQAIKAGKQGLEIKSRHLDGHHQQIELYPLFNNDPEVSIMPFPEDVFRFTEKGMEFINADYNRIDQELTSTFTRALKEKGFVFPATVIGGKTTNLKPFDEGFFIRDKSGQVFHLKRILNQPAVSKTGIDPTLDIQDIIISENRRKEFYGTVITRTGDLYLISYDNYRLIPLAIETYDPSQMDFKLLINPLYANAIIGTPVMVHGTAMDTSYKVLCNYDLQRLDPTPAIIGAARDSLFPFQLCFENPYRGQAAPNLLFGGSWSLVGIIIAGCCFVLFTKRKKQVVNKGELAVILVTGLYGLLAISLIKKE